jgi:hypothetical protein
VNIADGGDGNFTESQSTAIPITGSRPDSTRLEIVVSDQVADTADVTLLVGTGSGAYSVVSDLSGLALGKITATATAVTPEGLRSLPATDTSRKVPDASGPVPPRVQILDGDGYLSPAADVVTAVPVRVTHLGPSLSASITLTVSDGTTSLTTPVDGNPATPAVDPLAIDTPVNVPVDFTGFADGTVTATATDTSDTPVVSGTDTTILDRRPPTTTIDSATSICFAFSSFFSTCSLEGTSTDALTNIAFVYVTGRNQDTGQTFARVAELDSQGKSVGWSLSGAALALNPGRWIFFAQAQDEAGNFEPAGGDSASVLIV